MTFVTFSNVHNIFLVPSLFFFSFPCFLTLKRANACEVFQTMFENCVTAARMDLAIFARPRVTFMCTPTHVSTFKRDDLLEKKKKKKDKRIAKSHKQPVSNRRFQRKSKEISLASLSISLSGACCTEEVDFFSRVYQRIWRIQRMKEAACSERASIEASSITFD